MEAILAIGDCNTLGAGTLENNSYPELLAARMGVEVTNCGYTMSTSREGLWLLRHNLQPEHSGVIIQFGLADSYATFKYAPYILYYPDNFLRKQIRGIVKKYKKICRNKGLNARFGEESVVPIKEYIDNVRTMVEICRGRSVLLPETIPHNDQRRNPKIRQYNEALAAIASDFDNCCLVPLYDDFVSHKEGFYADETHANSNGYAYMADAMMSILSVNANRT